MLWANSGRHAPRLARFQPARAVSSAQSARFHATVARCSFLPGDLLYNRYRMVRMLGRGGMGEVYEAEDLELQEEPPGIAADARMIAQSKQELQLSRKIASPGICRVSDLARHPTDPHARGPVTYFLTMELLNGETLSDYLHRLGPQPPLSRSPSSPKWPPP